MAMRASSRTAATAEAAATSPVSFPPSLHEWMHPKHVASRELKQNIVAAIVAAADAVAKLTRLLNQLQGSDITVLGIAICIELIGQLDHDVSNWQTSVGNVAVLASDSPQMLPLQLPLPLLQPQKVLLIPMASGTWQVAERGNGVRCPAASCFGSPWSWCSNPAFSASTAQRHLERS